METDYSPEAIKVLGRAKEIALALFKNTVSESILCAALFMDGRNSVGEFCLGQEIDRAAVYNDFVGVLDTKRVFSDKKDLSSAISFSENSIKLLEVAQKNAQKQNAVGVDPLHLLAACVKNRNIKTQTVFFRHRIRAEKVDEFSEANVAKRRQILSKGDEDCLKRAAAVLGRVAQNCSEEEFSGILSGFWGEVEKASAQLAQPPASTPLKLLKEDEVDPLADFKG